MLRIHRKANGEVVFTLSGRIDKEHIAELEALIAAEGKDRRIILDLKDMTLTGQDGINFLAQCEAADIALANCDPYVREWMKLNFAPRQRRVLIQVAKVAPTDSTVLILGETGTGKELVSRAIHKRSHRSQRAFIRVNCAAIPQSLINSELFGHEKGAFTGATQRRLGRFEAAEGGTLFLDEVGELPMETQIILLRILQEREFERVGGNQTISADVRIIAATNRDLTAAVAAGTFRRDLFYRINVFPVEMPSLRERIDDIPLLVEYLLDRYRENTGKGFRSIEQKTLDIFQGYGWPGNIRELQNVIERTAILCEGDVFSIDETWLKREIPQGYGAAVPFVRTRADREREIIEAALAESSGRVAGPKGAALKLGIPRQTLDSKIASLGIDKRHFQNLTRYAQLLRASNFVPATAAETR
jgi:formate hydrogenlyase transcriptional activator